MHFHDPRVRLGCTRSQDTGQYGTAKLASSCHIVNNGNIYIDGTDIPIPVIHGILRVTSLLVTLMVICSYR